MQPLPPDEELVRRLRAGDEAAFGLVLDRWSPGMLRLARSFVSTPDSAAECVQDTWLAVLEGLDRFEGRSALRTWVYRILVNTAKRRGVREGRSVPWSSVGPQDGPTVDPDRFQAPGEPYPGHWRELPRPGRRRRTRRSRPRSAPWSRPRSPTAGAAAGRAHPPGRAGLRRRRGLFDTGDHADVPAGAAAPRQGVRTGPDRGLPREGGDTVSDTATEPWTATSSSSWSRLTSTDALEPADRQRVLDHLDLCDGCSTYLEQVRATIRAVGDLPAPGGLPDEGRRAAAGGVPPPADDGVTGSLGRGRRR